MDDVLVPEITMNLEHNPTESVENCDGMENADTEDVIPFSIVDKVHQVPSDEQNGDNEVIPEADSSGQVHETPPEEQNCEIIAVTPDLPIPYSEQNGDVLDETTGDTNRQKSHLRNCNADSSNCDSAPVACIEINDEANAAQDDEKASKKPRKRELWKAQIPNDYTPEELEVYKELFGQGNLQIQFYDLHCTACHTHLGSAPYNQYKRFIHPLLKVLICKSCYVFYGSGEFDKDEDGSELYCRWCGQGGNVLCCAKCPYVFCQRCIKYNLGKEKLQQVLDSDDWLCFECVSSQTIKLRVIVRALYDYSQSEINIAAELNQPERLKIDSSLCCSMKPPKIPKVKTKTKVPTVKRKNSLVIDNETVNDDIHPKKKKIKLKTLSSLLTGNSGNTVQLNHGQTFVNPVAIASRGWEAQDEDEVVCTPDLSLLMPEEEEDCVNTPHDNVILPPPPPLTPISFLKNTESNIVNSPLNAYVPVRPSPKQLGYTLPKKAVILNASTNRPLLSTALSTIPKSQSLMIPVRFPVPPVNSNKVSSSTIVPGTKYDWFEKASQFTSRLNLNLTSQLSSLTKEQSTVNSLEGLATVHNNFQEILNNTVKSLTQIRKNLRNDFIAGLKTLRYYPTDAITKPLHVSKKSKNTNEDNDIIIVDAPSPTPQVSTHPSGSGRLKLKPVSSLLIDSAVITIPDDTPDEPDKPSESNAPSAEKPEQVDVIPSPVEEASAETDVVEEGLNPETMALIKRTLHESKFETIVDDNLKAKVSDDISTDLLKRMVRVRVLVDNNFGTSTPRIVSRRGYMAMNIQKEDEGDIENMLSSSIVLNISKRKVLDSGNFDGQILNASDESEHLSNGVI